MQYTNTFKYLDEFARQCISEFRTRLEGFGKVATGRLHQTMSYVVLPDLTVQFQFEDYAVFVDQGRRPGKQPPLDAIRQWCRVRNIPETAAYPIARKIGREGIAPTRFIQVTVARRQKQFEAGLEKALAKDAEDSL
jgi:hypothetical protein